MENKNHCKYCGAEIDFVSFCCFDCYQRYAKQMRKMALAKKIENCTLALLNRIWRKLKWIM